MRYGMWVRTKAPPKRAVTWIHETREDGTQRVQGRRWREVLGVGDDHDPQTYYAADVELAPPNESMEYPPGVDEQLCGYLLGREPDRYCPQPRVAGAAFCRKHEAQFNLGEEPDDHT